MFSGLFGGGEQEGPKEPTIVDSHEQVDPSKEIERIRRRIEELEANEEAGGDELEELRVLRPKLENLEGQQTGN